MKVMSSPANDPTMAQNGRTVPRISAPRSNDRPVATAGRILKVRPVQSSNGIGNIWMGRLNNALVIVGNPM